MEGKHSRWSSQPRPCDLLRKIRELTRAIVEDLSNGRSPEILIDRFRNYCTKPDSNCYCSSDVPILKETLTLRRESHLRRLDVLLRVLVIVQQLLQENRHGSKRDIYYMHPSVFSDQSIVDRAINDICILMQCSRHNLNVVSVGKGLVMGWLRFSEAGNMFDCINRPNTAFPVPIHVEEVKDIVSVAKYILVVEKESVFQRLANDQFCNTNHCIVITGRGYPDISTRRFLGLLVDTLHLPTYCLVDCDPYGFDILSTYRFGSMQLAYDAKFLRVPEILWLGGFLLDSEKYQLPQQCLLPLTAQDKRKTEAMLRRCYLQREVPEWRLELQLMLERGVKFELEALSVHELNFLSAVYIPSKIQEKSQGSIRTFQAKLQEPIAEILSEFALMDSSIAQMTCVLKVNIKCKACKTKIYDVLQNIYGVYKIDIDAEQGTVKVSGKVNPSTLLMVLDGSGKHAELKSLTFDGEVKEGYDCFGQDGYGYGYGNGHGYGYGHEHGYGNGHGYGYGHEHGYGYGHGYNPYAVQPYYPCPPFGGFDYYDPSRLIMMPLSPPPPPPLQLPSTSLSVPQQSQPLQLQSQLQSLPPQPPALPQAGNATKRVAKSEASSGKKSICVIM